MRTSRLLALSTLISALAIVPVVAAETWIACEGTVVTTGNDADGKPVNETKPSKQTLAYDDAGQRLFRYSETRKTLDPVFVKSYATDKIVWGSATQGSSAASWEGALDRSNMSVSVVRKERGQVMTWTEQCKPTKPLA